MWAKERIEAILKGITSTVGATYTLDYKFNAPLTFNDPALTNASRPALEAVAGAKNIVLPAQQMGAEDFAYFQQKLPGLFFSRRRQSREEDHRDDSHRILRHGRSGASARAARDEHSRARLSVPFGREVEASPARPAVNRLSSEAAGFGMLDPAIRRSGSSHHPSPSFVMG